MVLICVTILDFEVDMQYIQDEELSKFEAKLLRTMQLTVDSRFEAGKRLKRLSKVGFITTTIISLGLILIPLLTVAGHNAVFSQFTLTSFQIFLAICVLVYSVATSTAKYELRSKDFYQCADEIKGICQKYQHEKIVCEQMEKNIDILLFEKLYRDALNGTESHEDIDYIRANKIRKEKKEKNAEIKLIEIIHNFLDSNMKNSKEKIISFFMNYSASFFLCIIELLFVSDMLGLTNALTFLHE